MWRGHLARGPDPSLMEVLMHNNNYQDVMKAICAFFTVHEHKGAFVPGLAGGRIPGYQNQKTDVDNQRGARTKKIITERDFDGLHADLKSLLDDPQFDTTNMFAMKEAMEEEDIDEW